MTLLKILTALLFFSQLVFAQSSTPSVYWNGYGQFRAFRINDESEGFKLRRTKLWIKGKEPHHKNFRYKVMGIFTYNHSGAFGLLDAYADYTFGSGYVRIGQQIPEFSLQREQPDWKIPVVERAAVINRMIPSAQSLARDIGVQVHWQPAHKAWRFAAGVFNGDGANLKSHSSSNFLYTSKLSAKFTLGENYSWYVGGSAMYRKAENSDFSLTFGKEHLYTGDDFRYGLETLLIFQKLELQAEFIQADFKGRIAHGYYAYANYNLSQKDQIVLSTEQLVDLNETTNDATWLLAGYNHLFDGHNLKLMLSGATQFQNNYSLTIQLQLFFN